MVYSESNTNSILSLKKPPPNGLLTASRYSTEVYFVLASMNSFLLTAHRFLQKLLLMKQSNSPNSILATARDALLTACLAQFTKSLVNLARKSRVNVHHVAQCASRICLSNATAVRLCIRATHTACFVLRWFMIFLDTGHSQREGLKTKKLSKRELF